MNDVERKANMQSNTNFYMREINVERYESSLARFGDRLEKITQKKKDSRGRGNKQVLLKMNKKANSFQWK